MKPDENKRRHITVVGRSGMSEVNWDDIQNKPDFAEVATSGEYDDLENKPTIPTVPPMGIETLTFTLQGGTVKTVNFYTVPNYFYVENVNGFDTTLRIKKGDSSAPDVEVFYSTDSMSWTSMGTTSTAGITATIPASGKIYLKANTNSFCNNNISSQFDFNVGGNILSLLYGDNFEGKTSFPSGTTQNFMKLFQTSNSHIINAENLILPATTTQQCYSTMFSGCSSLITAPALPATILANGCYRSMFSYCSSLTEAPVLPATRLANQCYLEMFYNCRKLNKVTTYATNISASACLSNWLYNVPAQGDFYNLGGITYPSGASGIPEGWTEHTSL